MKHHFRLRDYIFLFVVAGIIIIFDQWTKNIVRTNLVYTDVWAPWNWLLPFARIVHWQNTGAAFGMFQGMSLIFAGLAVVVSAAIIYYFPTIPKEDWVIRLALGMMLGGALGNLIDRIRFGGAVTDFISVGSFAVFNIADASISVGVVVLILGMWLHERRIARENTGQVLDPSEEQLADKTLPTAPSERTNGE